MTIIRGVDVSAYQTITSWSQLERAVGFVVVKATEGPSYTSRTWRRYFADARQVGLLVGSYHFAHPDQDARAQAAHYVSELRAAGWRSGRELPPVLDLEQAGGLGRSALTAWALTFMREVDRRLELTGAMRCGLYVNSDYLNNRTRGSELLAGRWLWLARWPSPRGPWPDTDDDMPAGASIWQWTDRTTVSGVSGPLDGDVATLATLRRLAPTYYDMTPTEDDLPTANEIADAVWAHSLTSLAGNRATAETYLAHIRSDAWYAPKAYEQAVANAAHLGALRATIDTLANALAAGAENVDVEALAQAVREASEAGARAALADSVSVDINVDEESM